MRCCRLPGAGASLPAMPDSGPTSNPGPASPPSAQDKPGRGETARARTTHPGGSERSDLSSVAEVLGLLRSHGGRVTRSRRVILEVLFAAAEHMNAEEIGAEVARVEPAVNMSTVYRNLEELQQLGVVVHTHLGHGPATYRVASAAHPHLYCESCGSTFHLPLDIFEELSGAARRIHGFCVDATHFAIPGRCAACSEE